MKGWIVLGVVLAVSGVVLFLNGLNSRMGGIGARQTEANSFTASSAHPEAAVQENDTLRHSELNSTAVDAAEQGAESPFVTYGASSPSVNPSPTEGSGTKTDKSIASSPLSGQWTEFAPFPSDPDGRKAALLRVLKEANWQREELDQLHGYLLDPRADFRKEILVRNSTFTESADQYAHNFTTESIERSVNFLKNHHHVLHEAERAEGVPSEILVAILKVETNLGEWRGKESVFNVYWSLSLGDDPEVQRSALTKDPLKTVEMKGRMVKRAFWAQGQLRDLLYVAKHGGEDPVGILGSFAGAFGLPQFIPSSYRSFGRDGNGDGVIDLDAIPDAVRSIGYYLKENGWPARPDRGRMRKAILNYNHSSFYADCVLALADSVSMRMSGSPIAN